jgi:hypothetical protein
MALSRQDVERRAVARWSFVREEEPMLRRLLALIALAAVLSSAGCLHHRHFVHRRHADCCAPACCVPSCCDPGPGPGPVFHGP